MIIEGKMFNEIKKVSDNVYGLIEELKYKTKTSAQYDALRDSHHLINVQHTRLLISNVFGEGTVSPFNAKEYLTNVIAAMDKIISTHGDGDYNFLREKAESLLVMVALTEN